MYNIVPCSFNYCYINWLKIITFKLFFFYFISIIALSTERGEQIMKPHLDDCEGCSINLRDVRETMTFMLAYDAWILSQKLQKWEIENAGPAVTRLMTMIQTHLPKEERKRDGNTPGLNGYHKLFDSAPAQHRMYNLKLCLFYCCLRMI